MQENPVLVLFDLRGHFEQREDHGGGLGRGQGRVGERVGAEGMVAGHRPRTPSRSRVALARKVVAEVRSLWRSLLTALISFSQLPRAQ